MAERRENAKAVGVDVGTHRIVAARPGDKGVHYSSQLNAFVDLPISQLTLATLSKEGVLHSTTDSRIFVHGSEAIRFADLLGTEIRQSKKNGVLNTHDGDALTHTRTLLEHVVGPAECQDQRLYFSVPAPLEGFEQNAQYYEASLRHMFSELGYRPTHINEGLAVVYSEMESTNYTGIGISCGAGLCNICFSYLSIPVCVFALPKAGDYVDSNAATTAGELSNRIRLLKEDSFTLNGASSLKTVHALTIYYDDMIAEIVREMKKRLEPCARSRRFTQPVPVVLSGGSTLVKGFLERFSTVLAASDFPMNVSEVRLAAAPLDATANGALMAALSEDE